MPGPIHPDKYDGEHLNTDAKLEAEGWAAGLDVWEQVDKAYGNYLGDGTLANAQLWSLKRAIRAEVAAEIEAALAADQADDDVTSGAAVWEQGGYRNGLSAAVGIARGGE